MGGGKSSAPATPDYTGAAIAQGNATQKLTDAQTVANHPNINTPWGAINWSQGGTPASSSFDEAGYNKAMADYNSRALSGGMNGGGMTGNLGPSMAGGYGGTQGGWRGGGQVPGAVPTREQFTTNTPATNNGVWTGNVTLTPEEQAALSSQQRISQGKSGAAEALLPQVMSSFGKQIDTSGLPNMPGQIQGLDLSQLQGMRGMTFEDMPAVSGINLESLPSAGINPGETYTDAAMRFYQPQFDQQRNQQAQTLANQGIGIGAEAYSAAGRDLADQQDRARLQATMMGMDKNLAFRNQGLTEQQALVQSQLARRQQGLGEQQALTGWDLARRQQGLGEQQAVQQGALNAAQGNMGIRQAGINEQQQLRGIPLNELNALLTGAQVQNPQFPNTTPAGVGQAPNLLGALQGQYDAQLNQTNASNASGGNFMSGLFGLGSAGLMAL